jgi:hypothetical protein
MPQRRGVRDEVLSAAVRGDGVGVSNNKLCLYGKDMFGEVLGTYRETTRTDTKNSDPVQAAEMGSARIKIKGKRRIKTMRKLSRRNNNVEALAPSKRGSRIFSASK